MVEPHRRRLLQLGLAAPLAGLPAQPAPAQGAIAADEPSAKASGALGQDLPVRLRDRFASLAQARTVFPSAFSLDQTVDHAGLQQALDLGGQRRTIVRFEPGRYILSHSLALPNFVSVQAQGAVISNQYVPLPAPALINQDRGSFVSVGISGLTVLGGTHAVKLDVTGEVSGIGFENCWFELQTDKNFECNKLLQAVGFKGVGFAAAPYGLYVAGFTTNYVIFEGCQFLNHSRTHLHLRSAEVVSLTNCRFEGGGDPAAVATIDVEDARNLAFRGCYFEATHPLLLRERRSSGTTSFDNCHFTGGRPGTPFVPYGFDSDGIVQFGTNSWAYPSPGPRRMLVTGTNGAALTRSDAAVWDAVGPRAIRLAGPLVRLEPGTWRRLVQFRLADGAGAAALAADLTMVSGGTVQRATIEVHEGPAGLGGAVGGNVAGPVTLRLRAAGPRVLELEATGREGLRWSLATLAGLAGDGRIVADPLPAV